MFAVYRQWCLSESRSVHCHWIQPNGPPPRPVVSKESDSFLSSSAGLHKSSDRRAMADINAKLCKRSLQQVERVLMNA